MPSVAVLQGMRARVKHTTKEGHEFVGRDVAAQHAVHSAAHPSRSHGVTRRTPVRWPEHLP